MQFSSKCNTSVLLILFMVINIVLLFCLGIGGVIYPSNEVPYEQINKLRITLNEKEAIISQLSAKHYVQLKEINNLKLQVNNLTRSLPQLQPQSQSEPEPAPAPEPEPDRLAIHRKIFPEKEPQVCIAFLSCDRHDLLDMAMQSIIFHLESNFSTVTYEVAIVEQCSTFTSFKTNILDRWQVEHYTYKRVNTGIGYGLNSLFFGLCTAPHLLSMEDDWKFIGPRGWLERGIDVLNYYNEEPIPEREKRYKVIGVFGAYNAGRQSDPLNTTKGTIHRVYLPELMDAENAAIYSFCNGGTLANTKALKVIGMQVRQTPLGTEREFKERILAAGYRMAMLPSNNLGNGWDRAFMHLGDGRHLHGN